MSQKRINFLNQGTIQLLKNHSAADDFNIVDSAERIWRQGVRTGDTIVDVNMRTSTAGATLDWTVGSPNDYIVKISKGGWLEQSDLTGPYQVPQSSFHIVTLNQDPNIGPSFQDFPEYIANIFPIGNKVAFVGGYGSISHYDFDASAWRSYKYNSGPSDDGSKSKGNIAGSSFLTYSGKSVLVCQIGISSFDGTNWKAMDGSGTGTGLYLDIFSSPYKLPSGILIEQAIVYNTFFIITSSGYIASYDGTDWRNSDGSGSGTGPHANSVELGSQSVWLAVLGSNLICLSSSGKMSSFDGSDWRYWDGSGLGSGPYGDFGSKLQQVYSYTRLQVYNSILFVSHVVTGHSPISTFDGTNWRYYDGSGLGGGPYDDGTVLGNTGTNFFTIHDSKLVAYGIDFSAGKYRFGSWDGSDWRKWDGSGGGTGFHDSLSFTALFPGHSYSTLKANGIGSVLYAGGPAGCVSTYDSSSWRLSDGSGTGSGIYNDDTSITGPMGGGIDDGVLYQNKLVVASPNGISYYDFDTSSWYYYNGSVSNSTINQLSITLSSSFDPAGGEFWLMTVYGNYLIVADPVNNTIASYDGSHWRNSDGSGSGTGPYSSNVWPNAIAGQIYSLAVYGSQLLVGGLVAGAVHDAISSFDGSDWRYWDGSGTGTGIYYNFTWAGEFFGGIVSMITYNNMLVAVDLTSGVASWDGSQWRYADGSGTGGGPFSSYYLGSFFNEGPGLAVYNGTLLILSVSGLSSWDGSDWKYFDESGTGSGLFKSSFDLFPTNPNNNYNDLAPRGSFIFNFGSTIVFMQNRHSGISSYDGSNWRYSDGSGAGTGPHDRGFVLGREATPTAMIGSADGFYLTARVYLIPGQKVACFTNNTWHYFDGSTKAN